MKTPGCYRDRFRTLLLINAAVNGFSFESSIVRQQKKFYLLIDAEAAKAAGVSNVSILEVDVEPYAE